MSAEALFNQGTRELKPSGSAVGQRRTATELASEGRVEQTRTRGVCFGVYGLPHAAQAPVLLCNFTKRLVFLIPCASSSMFVIFGVSPRK